MNPKTEKTRPDGEGFLEMHECKHASHHPQEGECSGEMQIHPGTNSPTFEIKSFSPKSNP